MKIYNVLYICTNTVKLRLEPAGSITNLDDLVRVLTEGGLYPMAGYIRSMKKM